MLRKGSSLWIKKIVGVSVALILFNVEIPIPYIKQITLALAAFYLLISGRQL